MAASCVRATAEAQDQGADPQGLKAQRPLRTPQLSTGTLCPLPGAPMCLQARCPSAHRPPRLETPPQGSDAPSQRGRRFRRAPPDRSSQTVARTSAQRHSGPTGRSVRRVDAARLTAWIFPAGGRSTVESAQDSRAEDAGTP